MRPALGDVVGEISGISARAATAGGTTNAVVIDVDPTSGTVGVRFTVGDTDVQIDGGVPVLGDYVPEIGHQVQVVMNGPAPLVLPPATGFLTTAPPAIPQNVSVIEGIGSVNVTWDPVDDASVAHNRGYYQVQIDTGGDFASENLQQVDVAGTHKAFTGLQVGVPYYAQVRAVTYMGVPGDWSPGTEATFANAAPVDAGQMAPGSGAPWQVATLPNLPDPQFPQGSVVFNSTDNKLYRNTGTAWTSLIDGLDVTVLTLQVSALIESTTYTPGSAGWIIKADGSAEFNNVVVRGQLVAGQITSVEGTNEMLNGDFETNVSHWTPTNAALTRDTGQHNTGAASMKITGSGGAVTLLADPQPVTPGQTYLFGFFLRAATTAQQFSAVVVFKDGGGGTLSTTTFSPIFEALPTDWCGFGNWTLIAPATAATAVITIQINSVVNTEVHHLDTVRWAKGSTLIGSLQTSGTAPYLQAAVDSVGRPGLILQNGLLGNRQAVIRAYVDPSVGDQSALFICSDSASGDPTITMQSPSLSAPSSHKAFLNLGAGGGIVSSTPSFQIQGQLGAGTVSALLDGKPMASLLGEVIIRNGTDHIEYTYNANATPVADVDATNLKLTFTAPASGEVLVELSAKIHASAAGNIYWGLRDNSNVDVGATCTVVDPAASGIFLRGYARQRVSGLTPGNSYTWKWTWHDENNGPNLTMYSGPSNGSIEYRIWGVFS